MKIRFDSIVTICVLIIYCSNVVRCWVDDGFDLAHILIERPAVPFCVNRLVHYDQDVTIFTYARRPKDANASLTIRLTNDDTQTLIAESGPLMQMVEIDIARLTPGMYSVCVRLEPYSEATNVALTLGIFVLGGETNSTDNELPPVHIDEQFGHMKLENLTHIASRVMLAVSNIQHTVRQSALYMNQDTRTVEESGERVNFWSMTFTLIALSCAFIQTTVLKYLFRNR